jgi:N-acetylglucosaminyl-diphospho-decaprenol L-rhamnosyltransferase
LGKAATMISVIIVTYNSQDSLSASLPALAQWLPDAEKIVIDNASADSSREIAERHGARMVALNRNIGFGRACNIGASQALQGHILFLNPDVVIRDADVTQLTRRLGADDFGLVVPSSPDDRFIAEERFWTSEALSLTLGTLVPRELPAISSLHRGGRIKWASGAALLVRRAEFLDIGGFDDRYFLYYEDRELSWRYRQAGLPVTDTSALSVEHTGGGSTDLGDRRSSALAFALMGWLQYMCTAHGPRVAVRACRFILTVHNAITRSAGVAADIVPITRLRRKSIQLSEVEEELKNICRSAGIVKQSDGHAYWPDSIRLLRESTKHRAG